MDLRVTILTAIAALGVAGSAHDLDGRAPTAEELRPSVEAAFDAESYRPGARAALAFFDSAPGVTVQVFHIGSEQVPTVGNDELQGVPVTTPRRIGAVRSGRSTRVAIGDWPTGVYFAR